MKNAIFFLLFLFCFWQANSQNYLQEANACFDKGEYECAKNNYTLFAESDSTQDVSLQIQKTQRCLDLLALADRTFKNQAYAEARGNYKALLDENPKDPQAKRKYYICRALYNRFKTNALSAQGSSVYFVDYTETNANLKLEMVAVLGGTFTMGCTAEQGANCNDDETSRQITLKNFYIGRYTITQAQWREIMGDNPSNFTGDNLPVEQVSWKDVQKFLRKLNTITGRRYRLPTEAEWEFASKGGIYSEQCRYSGSNNSDDVAWYEGNSDNKPHPVGSKNPNELGIYDMSGNVYEWCQDKYGAYSPFQKNDPSGSPSGAYRVYRGGGWGYDAGRCRVSARNGCTADYSDDIVGFRIALSQ